MPLEHAPDDARVGIGYNTNYDVQIMLFIRGLFFFILLVSALSASERLEEFYDRAIPTIDRFKRHLELQGDFAVFTLFNNIAIIVSAKDADARILKGRPDAPCQTQLLHLAEKMQDQNPDSRTFGNFRWYWNSPGVTDHNAVEFALARMFNIYLDTPQPLSQEDKDILYRMFERSVNVCMSRRIRPDYTNIAFYNAVHLILLGQILEREDVLQRGKDRLANIAAHIWNHGVFEYNSPAYYPINIDTLQLGLRHIEDVETQRLILGLLELFWTDMSLHWFKSGLRLAGAQSRTYSYLHGGNVHIHRLFAFAGMTPYDHDARYHAVLNSFRALYQPSPGIVALSVQYPRWVTRNWGRDQGQWASLFLFEDIALGTAGAKYDAQQNIVLVVDIADDDIADDNMFNGMTSTGQPSADFHWVDWQYAPRSYFLADGREDPYGTKRFPSGSGGQHKALHLDALWYGSQRHVDALGLVLYPPDALNDSLLVNVQSHFIVRKPEEIWLGDKPAVLAPHQPITVGTEPIVFRYRTCAFGIRVVWTRNLPGEPAEVVLIDDANDHGVVRLTVEHAQHPLDAEPENNRTAMAGQPESVCFRPLENKYPGAALWVRIGSGLQCSTSFAVWREQFAASEIHRIEVADNDVHIAVAGQEGIVSLALSNGFIQTKPAAPLGILALNGEDIGRPILECVPKLDNLRTERDTASPVHITPSGTHWLASPLPADREFGIPPYGILQPSGDTSGAVRVNNNVSWQLQIDKTGNYELWGRVQTKDAEHDSFRVELSKRLPDGSFMRRSFQSDWHLGVREHWTWVRLPTAIFLDAGIWQLTLKPREYEGRIDRLFLGPSLEREQNVNYPPSL